MFSTIRGCLLQVVFLGLVHLCWVGIFVQHRKIHSLPLQWVRPRVLAEFKFFPAENYCEDYPTSGVDEDVRSGAGDGRNEESSGYVGRISICAA